MTDRYVHVLWCDDIRLEIGNKPSFMGVYTAGIVVPELPAVLPRLGVYAWINTSADKPIKKTNFRIVRDDGFVVLEGAPLQADETNPKNQPGDQIMIGLMVANIEVPLGCNFFNLVVETESEVLEGPKLKVSVNSQIMPEQARPEDPPPEIKASQSE